MNDLISRQAAIEEANEWLHDCFGVSKKQDRSVGLIRRLEDLPSAPTIDNVKRGKWINDKGLYKCTACNDLCTVAGWADCIPEEQMSKAFKFCPNCGAKMDEVE